MTKRHIIVKGGRNIMKKEYYCLRCQYTGDEEDVLKKNEMIRIKYRRMYDRITDFD